jgi:YjbE family integral membrane protein
VFDLISPSVLSAFFQVIMIDLVLAGDNAIVIGLAAAGLPAEQRTKVILIGIAAATLLRIVFALLTTQLLQIVGLLLAGGLLLLWVAWKMWRELHPSAEVRAALAEGNADPQVKTQGAAILQIAVADVSMSLDNVLAVAGAARDHMTMLVFGLVLSIALMGAAATVIARFLERYRWLSYLGLAIITLVALRMIWEGADEVWTAVASA